MKSHVTSTLLAQTFAHKRFSFLRSILITFRPKATELLRAQASRPPGEITGEALRLQEETSQLVPRTQPPDVPL